MVYPGIARKKLSCTSLKRGQRLLTVFAPNVLADASGYCFVSKSVVPRLIDNAPAGDEDHGSCRRSHLSSARDSRSRPSHSHISHASPAMSPTHDSQSNRREFLRKSATAAAAGAAIPYFAWSQPTFANNSANDRPVIGCVGLGGMGTGDAHEHHNFGDIVAVCDVDSNRAAAARHDGGIGKGKADAYGDYRKVLDRKDIDVVSVVTPDHWHVKIAIEALEAGKHVFSQKPLTLTLEENQLIRNAAKKYDKQVFFVGTQQRSDRDRFLRAINMVHKGLLGDIKKITVGINGGDVGGPFKKTKPPKELDWNFWLGQAPSVEYIKERCHYQFRWWYEYSGGKFTDWGSHHVDIATWAINHDKQGMGPIEVDGTDAKHPVPFKDGMPTVDDRYNTACMISR